MLLRSYDPRCCLHCPCFNLGRFGLDPIRSLLVALELEGCEDAGARERFPEVSMQIR